jgi:hypothetical protein
MEVTKWLKPSGSLLGWPARRGMQKRHFALPRHYAQVVPGKSFCQKLVTRVSGGAFG